jgi:hypothetical protein
MRINYWDTKTRVQVEDIIIAYDQMAEKIKESNYNEKNPFTIHQTHTIHFSFWDRVKILFGKKTTVWGTIEVDKEVNVLKGTSHTGVENFIEKKQRGYEEVIQNKENKS